MKQERYTGSITSPLFGRFWWQDWGWLIVRVIIDGAAIALGIWIGSVIEK